MAKVGLAFQLSANAAGMSAGINAGVVELQKLGLAAKKTSQDVAVLKTLQIGQAFLSGIRTITTTFTQFTSGASSAIDQSNKLSRALGISYEELTQLQLAADLAGANSEQLANAFTRAQVTITKAARGGVEATRALRSLGLSVNELSGLSASQQFERIATAVAEIQNPAQRAAAAVSIFGRSGAQLLPVFQELSSNLQRAEGFFAGFQRRLSANDASQVEAVNDAFTEVARAVQEVTGLVIAKLSPALLRGAESLRTFIQSVNIDDVAARASVALGQFARAAELLANIVSVGLQRPLFAAGAALAFINRQAIATGVIGLGKAFAAAATAAAGLASSATVASVALTALKVSIRGLLTATGVGAAVVVFGLLAEAAINFATRGVESAVQVEAEVLKVNAAIKKGQAEFAGFGDAAVQAGAKAKAALTVPNVSFVSLAQDALGQAASSVAELAKELGGLERVPGEILAAFGEIQLLVQDANTDLANQNNIAGQILTLSQRLTASLKAQADARRADTDAAQKAADEARKINEASRDRVRGLAEQGLSPVDRSRLQLARDLADIDRERTNAQRELRIAQQTVDADAVRAARERLSLADQAARAAQEQAKRILQQQRSAEAELARLRGGGDGSLVAAAQERLAGLKASAQQVKESLVAIDRERLIAQQQLAKAGQSEELDAIRRAARERLSLADQAARAARLQATEIAQAQQRAEADLARAIATEGTGVAGSAAKQVSDLIQAGEQVQSQLQAINRERTLALRELSVAQQSVDVKAVKAAQDRLRLADEATKAAINENRQSRLQALGINETILRPARTLADEFQAVRDAFRQRLINPDEARNALRNLAAEGIEIRREIDRELRRPSAEALRVADIRSSEGIAQFFAAGRRDPAVDQRQQQIAKLEEIRQALINVGAVPVDILGAA